jgi:hypothetical protein
MSIIRSPRKDRGFIIVSNDVAQDPRLSMRALGLLVRLLSRPDHWETNSEKLAHEFDVGREQMQGVLRELSSFGYMKLVKTRRQDGTIFSQWHVFDEPESISPETGKPAPEKPYAGKPVANSKNRLRKNLIDISVHQNMGEMFNKFWGEYPKKVGKDAAQKAFVKRKPTDELVLEMIKALSVQKQSDQWMQDGGKFIPNPATWLNQGRWMDELATVDDGMPDWMRGAI